MRGDSQRISIELKVAAQLALDGTLHRSLISGNTTTQFPNVLTPGPEINNDPYYNLGQIGGGGGIVLAGDSI